MSSANPSDPNAPAQTQGERGPAQAPASGGGYAPPPNAPPGQQPYSPYPPPGGYSQYPPPQGYYPPPPPGQYYPPPPGAPGAPGAPQYPYYGYPPAGGYYTPYATPPVGSWPPPPAGAPGAPPVGQPAQGQAGQVPGQPGQTGTGPADPLTGGAQAAPHQHQPGQYAPPPPGAPPAGYYPPPAGTPGAYPFPPGTPSAPTLPPSSYPPPPGHPLPPHPGALHPQDPLIYLGTPIPNPEAPPAALGVQKVPGYDPAHDYNEIVRSIVGEVGDEKKQYLSSKDEKAGEDGSSTSPTSPQPPSPSLLSVPTSTSISSSSRPSSPSQLRPSSPSSTFLSRLATKLTLSTPQTQTVLKVLSALDVFQMDALNDYFVAKTGIPLADRLATVTSGNFGTAIRALALGPLWFDVDLLHKSIVGLGTNEMALIELILGRPGHEIRWLKKGYQLRYGRDLVSEVRDDLSGKVEQMFVMALNTQKPVDNPYAPPDQRQVEQDIESLHNASKKKDEITFCEILINRSDSHLGAVIAGYGMRYKSLSKVIKKTFSGTIESALLYIMHGVKPKRDRQGFWRDAKLLEKSMAGLGTKDNQLIYRLVRTHWDKRRMEAVKDAYKRRYGKTLESRVRGETSGVYRDLLVELIRAGEAK